MIRRINFFGGPGVGKSTLATRVFTMMSMLEQSVAQVQEVIKQYVYAKRSVLGWNYVLTYAQQLNAEYLPLNYGVQRIVTDSPLLLQSVYAQIHGCPVASQIAAMCFEFERHYPSVNFLIERHFPFQSEGRFQTTEEEAIVVDGIIEDGIACHGIPFTRINPNVSDENLRNILYSIEE